MRLERKPIWDMETCGKNFLLLQRFIWEETVLLLLLILCLPVVYLKL